MKEIAASVAAALQDVYILGKDDRNAHGNYAFASIDKFLEMVNPICAKHGLFPVMTCTGIETYEGRTKNGASLWGRYTFDITLTHNVGRDVAGAADHRTCANHRRPGIRIRAVLRIEAILPWAAHDPDRRQGRS